MTWLSSIRGRFLVLSALTVGLALALTAALLVSLFSSNIRKRIDAELTSHVNTLAGALSFGPTGQLERPKGPVDQRFTIPYGGLYWQIVDDSTGQTIRSTSLFDTALDLPADRHTDGTIHRYVLPGPEGTSLIVLERLVRVAAPEGERALRIAVAIDQDTLDEARAGFIRDILPAIGGLGLFLVGASLAQLAFGLRPLSSLSEGIDRIRERRDTRLSGTYPAEFRSTVNAVNQLLETQGAMIEKARSRAADLAHGLRTPLTVLANDALNLREKGETALADELEHLAGTMRTHVERELALSRIAARPDLRRGDSNVAGIVSEITRTLRRTPGGEAIDLVEEGPSDLSIPVDPGDFRELAGNLIENAVKWARARIVIRWGSESGKAWLTVLDDGPGVPEAEIGNLTRRGWRLDSAKPGSGLGLSIVREIADVYGIGFTLRNEAGSGLLVRLDFPA
ncbi:sensor histidine kinase [Gellertiella hungarica]|uniref:histidine kinase n=1 Tax=Gellertiella hungarica TaxID=1572859 RepID=A0A7W6J3H7_9HYPH|nr:HAMP domain-containing sensor histidine kinase [Gellertiella hungarica]MBB4063291.1 signal transduction histidine kinase [Gellertiella hungarica]